MQFMDAPSYWQYIDICQCDYCRSFRSWSQLDAQINRDTVADKRTADGASEAKMKPLPVVGYTAQKPEAVRLVNYNKQLEEKVLRVIDDIKGLSFVDPRWIAEARTDIEKGFMSMNRAIFKPERVKLDDE